mgnify:CR=1 FL=1
MGFFDNLFSSSNSNMDAIEIVKMRANQAGWKLNTLSSNLIVIGFLDELGVENVYIRKCGENSDGKTILEFSSKGIPLPDDLSLAALFGLMLLERNADMLMGHWGIEIVNGEKYFTVFHSMIAEGMDISEFKGAVKAIVNEKNKIKFDSLMSQIRNRR